MYSLTKGNLVLVNFSKVLKWMN